MVHKNQTIKKISIRYFDGKILVPDILMKGCYFTSTIREENPLHTLERTAETVRESANDYKRSKLGNRSEIKKTWNQR